MNIDAAIKCLHHSGDEKTKIKYYRDIYYSTKKHALMRFLEDLTKYGSVQGYFYFLMVSNDKDIDNHIYEILCKKLRQDIESCAYGKKITDLCKWLPRENRYWDTRLKFVNNFVTKFFPTITRLDTAKKEYRSICTTLNNYNKTLEVLLSNHEAEKVEYEKLTQNQINKYFYNFTKNDGVRFKDFLIKKHTDNNIIETILREKKIVDGEKEIINDLWKLQIYPSLENNKERLNNPIVINLTPKMFENRKEIIYEIIISSIMKKNPVYINNTEVKAEYKDNIFDFVKDITKFVNYDIINKLPNHKYINMITWDTDKDKYNSSMIDYYMFGKKTFFIELK